MENAPHQCHSSSQQDDFSIDQAAQQCGEPTGLYRRSIRDLVLSATVLIDRSRSRFSRPVVQMFR